MRGGKAGHTDQGLSRALERALSGREFLLDGRHRRSFLQRDIVHASALQTVSAAPIVATARERGGHRGERRQGCQRLDREPRGPPKRVVLHVKQSISPMTQERKLVTPSGTNEAQVLVGKREMADVGPTYRASRPRGAARRVRGATLASRVLRISCWRTQR
jgi:hypothetical protein